MWCVKVKGVLVLLYLKDVKYMKKMYDSRLPFYLIYLFSAFF